MNPLPYWIDFALRPTLALAWMVVGLGLPWALVALPRKDWRSRPLVALVMVAVGPMLLTAWMFVLGTLGGAREAALLTPVNIWLGTLVIAGLGAALAYRTWRTTPAPPPEQRQPLALDERLLLTLVIAACVLRWLAAVWYPFWEYDPLWVYGYEGKLYTLLGYIPQHIGYYPQFLPLQYAYAQIMTGGVNDHTARSVFPIYHWGSILAAYALGRLNFSRRVGIYMAVLWAMYPHVAQWSTVGDLEIPLTFAATGFAAFFLRAWRDPRAEENATELLPQSTQSTQRAPSGFLSSPLSTLHSALRTFSALGPQPSALLSGAFLGLAMWTKPTGGALILGVALLVAAEGVRVRFDWMRWRPRVLVALWCGAASFPLGAIWYARNVLLGHRAIDFPHPFWLTQAMRSGVEFGWPMLAAALLSAWLLWGPGPRVRPNARRLALGWALITAALLPSVLWPHRMGVVRWTRFGVDVGIVEWALLLAGIAVLLTALWPLFASHATASAKRETSMIGWGLLLALPYFAVWFYSYSYHYRLSFAIVPLLMLPVAVILARWIPPQHGVRLSPRVGLPLLLVCIPALVAPLFHYEGGWDYLWSNEYPNDWRRLDSTNYALSMTVQQLRQDIAQQGIEHPVIFAPGLQRLPFFFPLDDVRIAETPTDLEQLRGVDYYVYTQEARWLYEENDAPEVNPVTGSMERDNLLGHFGGAADASFFSLLFRVRDIDNRFEPPRNINAPEQPVEWPFAALAGTRLNRGTTPGSQPPPRLTLSFLAGAPASLEYTLYIHLLAPDGTLVTTWDSLPVAGQYAWYSTRLWETGEYVNHTADLRLPEGVTLEPGVEYRIKVGWYDVFDDNRRVPALVGGVEADGVVLPYVFRGE